MEEAADVAAMLEGKVAVVVGTGPNIGGEVTRRFAEQGASLVCVDARIEQAERAAAEVVAMGGRAIGVKADITSQDEVAAAFDRAVAEFGQIDILVCNAAITHPGTILDTSLEDWQRVMDVSLTGAFLCGQQAARRMVEQGTGGAIVNVSSTSGHRGGVKAVAYSTAKAGILNLTRSMAIQLAPHGIRVNSVTPTQTGSPVGKDTPRENQGPPKSIPLGRWGEPADQAQAVLFLASPAADFITGVDLPVDGGLLATVPKG
jgi:NAD(P)-dependent dehydrogenase (short-subunit alcohol dehydrogenase family)